jgi:hypothetical protein
MPHIADQSHIFMDTEAWQRRAELLVDLPLHEETMPMLRLFQLDWEYAGIYDYYCQDLGLQQTEPDSSNILKLWRRGLSSGEFFLSRHTARNLSRVSTDP